MDDEENPERGPDAESEADAPEPAPSHAEWVLQADAARIAGCSVSAIRKWRREGVVDDRRTTTLGGLERVEVRLQDVIDRCGHREAQPSAASANPDVPAASSGTVFLPLGDLQAMILNLGEAERRALESTNRATAADAELQRLADALTRTEAALAVARSDADSQRRRIRDLEAAGAAMAATPTGPNTENERLREQIVRLEARMGESRSEVDGQRRRIRELEARLALPPKGVAAAEAESARLREQLTRLESRLAATRNEMDGQRRRIRELEAALAAADSETEGRRLRVAELEAALNTAQEELDAHRRRVAELEAALVAAVDEAEAGRRRIGDGQRRRVAELEAALVAAVDEAEGGRRHTSELEAALAAAIDEVDAGHRRIGDLEAALATAIDAADGQSGPAPNGPVSGVTPAEAEDIALEPPEEDPPEPEKLAPVTTSLPAPRLPSGDWPPPPPTRRRAAGLADPTDGPGGRRRPPPKVGAQVKVAVKRWRQRQPVTEEPTAVAPPVDADPTATQLRRLYQRLQARRRDEGNDPDENRRWAADLAAYDEALVLACAELGVPTGFAPGDRLPAEERVRLTRDLGAAGLDVRQDAAG